MWTPPSEHHLRSRDETSSKVVEMEQSLSTLRTTLTNNQAKQLSIASQISALQSSLGPLQIESTRLESRIKNLEDQLSFKRAYFSPVRNLPKEMLGAIFIAHVKLDWKAPLIDSSVSKRWRNTALSTPRLWSFLRLPPHPLSPELTTLWLQRAVNAPLHVHITNEDVSPQLLEIIKNVYCMKFKPWPTFLHNTRFSKLEKLILDHDDASMDHLQRGVFTSLPKLRVLHLHWFRLSRRPLLQWAWDLPPLEEFHISGASWVWIDALELVASSLKRLAVDIGDVPTPPPPSIPLRTLHLPNLTYFAYGAQSRTLTMNDKSRIPIVSRVIHAPNLQVFEGHTVVPRETSLKPSENWDFPGLKEYVGRTSRELGEVRVLYPNLKSVTFMVDAESGVLDVAGLIDAATNGTLEELETVETFSSGELKGHPTVEQSLIKFEEVRGRKLRMVYHTGREETPYQKCYFGFPCCEVPIMTG